MITRQKLLHWVLKTLRKSAWAPFSVFGVYMILKEFGAYLLYPPLDIPTHFMGGVAIAYFYQSAIANSQELVGDIPLPIQGILALTCTGTTTVLWEFFEYTSDFFLHSKMILSLEDTLKDMFLGLIGGLILVLLHRSAQLEAFSVHSDQTV